MDSTTSNGKLNGKLHQGRIVRDIKPRPTQDYEPPVDRPQHYTATATKSTSTTTTTDAKPGGKKPVPMKEEQVASGFMATGGPETATAVKHSKKPKAAPVDIGQQFVAKDRKPPSENPPPIKFRIDNETVWLSPDKILDDEALTALGDKCNATESSPKIWPSKLLNWPPGERIACLRFLSLLPCQINFIVAKQSFDDPFSAMLAMVCGIDDLHQHQASKMAALDAAVAIYPRALEGACNRLRDRLTELSVKGVRIDALLKEARDILKQSESAAREQLLMSVKDVLPDAPVGEAAIVPADWELTSKGVAYGGSMAPEDFVPAPVVLTERHLDVGHDTQWISIAWLRDGNWQKRVVERRTIANTRSIVEELSAYGLPCTTNNAKVLVQYLLDYEAANIDHLPMSKVSSQLGWQGKDGGIGFLWGSKLIAPNDTSGTTAPALYFRGADEGDDQIAAGFHQRGTLKGWRQAIEKITPFPKVKLGFYAAFVSVLLSILRARNFVLDYSGRTTVGKTSTLRVAASVWGNPDESDPAGIVKTWDGTTVFRERVPSVLNNLPYFLDDSKLARRPDDVANTIYSVAAGRGRGRGSIKGLARQETWHTVLFTSGEQPATAFSQDGGTRARVIGVWGCPFKNVNSDTCKLVRRLNGLLKQHYGHAGPRFVKYVLDHQGEWEQWRKEYAQRVSEYEDLAGDNQFAGRMASDFAVVTVAARLAHEAIDLPWDYTDPIKPLWKELAQQAGEADRTAAALRHVLDWAFAHQSEFYGQHQSLRQPQSGWAGFWKKPEAKPGLVSSIELTSIGFIPNRLKAILEAGGYEAEAIVRSWWDDGWLVKPKEKNRREMKVRIGATQARVIVIARAAVEKVVG